MKLLDNLACWWVRRRMLRPYGDPKPPDVGVEFIPHDHPDYRCATDKIHIRHPEKSWKLWSFRSEFIPKLRWCTTIAMLPVAGESGAFLFPGPDGVDQRPVPETSA